MKPEIHEKHAKITINPKIYPLGIVYSAAYIMTDKAFILLDGDPEKEILVEIRPKNNEDIKELVIAFNEELLNYAVYSVQNEMNKNLREKLLDTIIKENTK